MKEAPTLDHAKAEAAARLIPPYGGELVNLRSGPDEREELRRYAAGLPYVQLTARSLCDLELLATGAFSPLGRFMGREDYESVLKDMRLAGGTLFPIPITLPVSEEDGFTEGKDIALRNDKNELVAVMTVEENYPWEPEREAELVYLTKNVSHPMVAELHSWGKRYLSGPLRVFNLPPHHDFASLRRTPAEVRDLLAGFGYQNVVAFQTRNPMHRAHEELTKRAADRVGGALLIHPVVGMTKPGDVDHITRVRTYRVLVEKYFNPGRTVLSLLPLAMRLAGPREAVWHAIIRRNHGANHLIVGRDHAGPGKDPTTGKPFYGPYDAQELLEKVGPEIGVGMIPFKELGYLPEEDRYEEMDKMPEGRKVLTISGTQVRDDYLSRGKKLPEWFTHSEIAEILGQAYPPRHQQGFCVWFTGLPSAGKSTIAQILVELLAEHGRNVTVLDGDIVRTHLSKGLGFSKEDRDTNIRRIGFVAAEIVRHEGVAVCAAVSPYRATRNQVRNMVGADRFVLVHVNTPVEVCEQRDPKGMYARARRGEIKEFTGVDDPYERPEAADIVLSTTDAPPEADARKIIRQLEEKGFLLPGK